MIGSERSDLSLMDIGLPGMDGLSLTTMLKEHDARMDIVIVAPTAFATKGDSDRASAAGWDAYIAKPFTTGLPATQIRKVLQNARAKVGTNG